MRFSTARLAVTAGLAAMLTLGGCSFSSKTETTTSISDGNTTTTTTTTTENGETSTETNVTSDGNTTATQDISTLRSYTLDDFGIAYDLPDGFTFTEVNTNLDLSGNAVAFQASNGDKSTSALRFVPIETRVDVNDESFISERIDEAKQSAEQSGVTVKDAHSGSLSFGDKTFPTVAVECEKGGAAYYMEFLYFSLNDEDADAHSIGQLVVASDDANTADSLIQAFKIQ